MPKGDWAHKIKRYEWELRKGKAHFQNLTTALELLERETATVNCSADKAVVDSENTFAELIRLLQARSADVTQRVRSKQKVALCRLREIQEDVEKSLTKIKHRISKWKRKLLELGDDSFLQWNDSPSTPNGASSDPSSSENQHLLYFEDVTASVRAVREKVEDVLRETSLPDNDTDTDREEEVKDSLPRTALDIQPPPPVGGGRADYLPHFFQITLDPNTAEKHLLLSDENRRATKPSKEGYVYPDHPDRFFLWRQVLSAQSLPARCYWEVELNHKRVIIAVTEKRVIRAGTMMMTAFGYCPNSWALSCNSAGDYRFVTGAAIINLTGPPTTRVGVYLDRSAGVLSFYGVCENVLTLIYKLQTTFTENPLCAGLRFDHGNGATAEFCELV